MDIFCIAANDCSSSDIAPAVKQLVQFEGQRRDTRLKRLERNVDAWRGCASSRYYCRNSDMPLWEILFA
ncbi:hypothetical protein CSE45_2562 [Citreicella sp. SE45]|nr:hypothetical protein CSE45_2562 [Citreicella sp. SE45]